MVLAESSEELDEIIFKTKPNALISTKIAISAIRNKFDILNGMDETIHQTKPYDVQSCGHETALPKMTK